MKTTIATIIAVITVATAAFAAPMSDEEFNNMIGEVKAKAAEERVALEAAYPFPKNISEWTEEQLSWALDPADARLSEPEDFSVIELAMEKFDKHVHKSYKIWLRLYCIELYDYLLRRAFHGGEINYDVLPAFIEKEAEKYQPENERMRRWFIRYASNEMGRIAEKGQEFMEDALIKQDGVAAFKKWRDAQIIELRAAKAKATKNSQLPHSKI